MRITSLALQNVRRYKDAAFELSPGLTVVRGPNEAGKSTLQRAIELALTRKVTSSAGDLDGLVPWDGDPDSRSAIALVFTYEDEDGGTHEGRLEKSFRGSKGQVRLELDGEIITDPARADEALAELSGLPTENFYRSTASIRHQELAEVQRDEGALRDRLQASISGADRGTSRARKKLDRALYALQTKGTKNPGRLKVADDAVTDATAKLQAGEDALGRLERDRDALAVARERRAETETALTERRAMLEKARQAERLNAEKTQAQERYERYRTAVIVRDEITELDRTHPSPTPLPVLRSTVERLRAVDRQIGDAPGAARRRGPGQLRGPARGPLAPAVALGAGPRRGRDRASRSPASPPTCSGSSTSAPRRCSSAARSRRSASRWPWSASGCGAGTGSRRSSRTPRSTGGSAAARRSSRSFARRPASGTTCCRGWASRRARRRRPGSPRRSRTSPRSRRGAPACRA